ncbi:hypothetical protein D3C79_755600 [compost metagenome]
MLVLADLLCLLRVYDDLVGQALHILIIDDGSQFVIERRNILDQAVADPAALLPDSIAVGIVVMAHAEEAGDHSLMLE